MIFCSDPAPSVNFMSNTDPVSGPARLFFAHIASSKVKLRVPVLVVLKIKKIFQIRVFPDLDEQ